MKTKRMVASRPQPAAVRVCGRVWILALGLVMLFGALAAHAAEAPMPGTQAYDFSTATQESVSVSHGTFAGLPEREPTPVEMNDLKLSEREKTVREVQPGFEVIIWKRSTLRLPENPPLEAELLLWREQAVRSLLEKWEQPDTLRQLGALKRKQMDVSQNAFLTNDLLCLLTSDDYEYRTATFDLRSGKQLTLSDLFYEDVNYIDYINRSIVQSMHKGGDWGNDYYSYYFYYSLETQQIAPFTGLSRDYPFFVMSGTTLRIYLPIVNPFFALDGGGTYGGLAITIPLWKKISPYGSEYKVETRYDSVHVPLVNRDAPQYQVCINDGESPEVDEAINQSLLKKLEEATGRFPEEVLRKSELEPFYSCEERLLSMWYYAYEMWPQEEDVDVVLYGATYDMSTGLEVDLEPVARAHASQAVTCSRSDTLYTQAEPYDLREGELDASVFVDAWIGMRDGELSLIARFQLEDGAYVELVIPGVEKIKTAMGAY